MMIKKLFIAMFILNLSTQVFAATTVTTATASTYTPDQQSVLTASEDWQQAVDARNPKAIAALYDPNAYFYPTFNKNQITNAKDLYQYFVNLSQKPHLQIIFDQENPRIYVNGTVAVNSGLYTYSYLGPNNKTVHVPARFTFVYIKENGQWVIVEHHSSVMPEKKVSKAKKPAHKTTTHKTTTHKTTTSTTSTAKKST
jgi:uncharacterized protein (TIGR02246 family)